MNSGLTAMRSGSAMRPPSEHSDNTRASTRSVVPGSTVLRSTTVSGRVRDSHAAPIADRDAREAVVVGLTVAEVGRADADERDVGFGNAFFSRVGGRQPALPDDARHQIGEPRLDDRRRARVDHRDLLRVHVDADHMMAIARETGGRDTSDISETEDTDVHRAPP